MTPLIFTQFGIWTLGTLGAIDKARKTLGEGLRAELEPDLTEPS